VFAKTEATSRGLTPTDVVNAVNAVNLTLPSGLAKISARPGLGRTPWSPTFPTRSSNSRRPGHDTRKTGSRDQAAAQAYCAAPPRPAGCEPAMSPFCALVSRQYPPPGLTITARKRSASITRAQKGHRQFPLAVSRVAEPRLAAGLFFATVREPSSRAYGRERRNPRCDRALNSKSDASSLSNASLHLAC
jgi:hypothetical protein